MSQSHSLRSLIFLFFTLTIAGCGGGSSGGNSSSSGGNSSGDSSSSGSPSNQPPTITSLEINPSLPYTDTPLSASIVASDPENDTLSYQYTWQVNNNEISQANSETLDTEYFSKGDTVTLTVTASDGQLSDSQSTSTTILNSAPTVDIQSDAIAGTEQEVKLTGQVSDVDGDPLSVQWSQLAGTRIVFNDPTSPTTSFSAPAEAGELRFMLTADDGEQWTDSKEVTITIRELAPKTASYGEPVQFQLIPFEKAEVPTSFRCLACPNGMVIDSEGNITWTPTGPLFTQETDFHWKVEAKSGSNTQIFGSTIRVIDPDRLAPISRNGLRFGKNNETVVIGDFDHSGDSEILVADEQNLYTITLKEGQPVQNWRYPFRLTEFHENLTAVAAEDITGSAHLDFIIGAQGRAQYAEHGALLVIDGETKRIVHTKTVEATTINSIRVLDTDLDGELEIALLATENTFSNSYNYIAILDAATLETEWQSPAVELGESMDSGQVNSDVWPEIITNNGFVYGFDGSKYINKWAYLEPFGNKVYLADLFGDGISEIVTHQNTYDFEIHIFDANSKSKIFSAPYSNSRNMTVGDTNDDGRDEIILGSEFRGQEMQALVPAAESPFSLIQAWSMESTTGAPPILRAGNLTGDNSDEILWTAENSGLRSQSYLSIASVTESGESALLMQSDSPQRLDGSFLGGKIITTQANKIAFASEDMNYLTNIPILAFLSPETGELEFSSVPLNKPDDFALKVVETDTDTSQKEAYILAKNTSYQHELSLYNYSTDSIQPIATGFSEPPKSIAAADLNDDGFPELIVAFPGGGLLESNTRIYDVRNASLISSLENIGGLDVFSGDIDRDRIPEVIATSKEALFIIDAQDETYSVINQVAMPSISDIAIGDIDSDGANEIVVATANYDGSEILILNSKLEVISNFHMDDLFIKTVTVENYGSGIKNLLLGINNEHNHKHSSSYLAVVDPHTGNLITRSPLFSGSISTKSVHLLDTNDDSIMEISYGTHHSMNVTR